MRSDLEAGVQQALGSQPSMKPVSVATDTLRSLLQSL